MGEKKGKGQRQQEIRSDLIPSLEEYLDTPGLPGGSDRKESACNAGNLSSIPGLGRSPGDGDSYPLQYSCLENSMDRGNWQAIVHGVAKSQLSTDRNYRKRHSTFVSMGILSLSWLCLG